MTSVAWPDKLKPVNFGYYPLDSDVTSGQSASGGEQFIISPGARWGAAMTLPIFDREGVLAIRALRSQLKGRANPTLLPNFDGQRLSWPVEALTDRILTPQVAQWLEGTLGISRTPYAGAEIPAAAQILATLQSDAALRATTVAINVTQGGPLIAGQQFGIGDRLYEIADIVSVVGGLTTVDIWPPLRAAAAVGTVVDFTGARCLMRCENMSEEMRVLEDLRFATLNLQFIEYF